MYKYNSVNKKENEIDMIMLYHVIQVPFTKDLLFQDTFYFTFDRPVHLIIYLSIMLWNAESLWLLTPYSAYLLLLCHWRRSLPEEHWQSKLLDDDQPLVPTSCHHDTQIRTTTPLHQVLVTLVPCHMLIMKC